MHFEGINPKHGNLQFITHTDHGPNADSTDIDGDGTKERPFPIPTYQAQWVRFEVSPIHSTVKITDRVGLIRADGTSITGLPNLPGKTGLVYADERPVDLLGNELTYDPYGTDMEGIVKGHDGTYWMVDEYRPAIYHFSPDGILIKQ